MTERPDRLDDVVAQRQPVLLLVEQNAAVALGLAQHAYLMETARVVMSGPAAELRQNDAILRAYLGN